MRKALVIGIIGFGLLAGCLATEQKYVQVLDTWKGESEQELVASWGVPDSVYQSSSSKPKYLTYNYRKTGYVPGISPTYQTSIIGNTAYTTAYGGSSGYSYNNNCKTTFTIVGSTITSWRYEGNACRSK